MLIDNETIWYKQLFVKVKINKKKCIDLKKKNNIKFNETFVYVFKIIVINLNLKWIKIWCWWWWWLMTWWTNSVWSRFQGRLTLDTIFIQQVLIQIYPYKDSMLWKHLFQLKDSPKLHKSEDVSLKLIDSLNKKILDLVLRIQRIVDLCFIDDCSNNGLIVMIFIYRVHVFKMLLMIWKKTMKVK